MDDAGLRALLRALDTTPADTDLRALVATACAEHGQLDEAEVHFRRALRERPRDEGLILGLVGVLLRSGRTGDARVLLEDLLERDGGVGKARALLARVLLAQGDVAAAGLAYRDALAADAAAADPELAERLAAVAPPVAHNEHPRPRLQGVSGSADPTARNIVERPALRFADVGGMEALKEEIRLKMILPLEHPELYRAYGKTAGGAILMYGPPGCGKTYLARATAGEVDAGFISVGIADVLDMWLGASERNLHELFETARRSAPCVLFFDEVDALAAKRSDLRQSAGRNVINQFLAELDGADRSNDGVLVLAATNAPWHLDPAFRRPGRFDRDIFVPPPDATARAAILVALLRGKPTEDIDISAIVGRTEGFSGADLMGLVDRAVEGRLAAAISDGFPSPLRGRDLVEAAKAVRPSTGEWFATARDYVLFANQGGAYDAVRPYVRL